MRAAVKAAIEVAGSGYPITDFNIEATYLPHETLLSIKDKPKIWVIGLIEDESGITRGKAAETFFPVQVGVQQALDDPTDDDYIDKLIELHENIRNTCRTDVDPAGFSWIRNEVLKDENDNPFNYVGAWAKNVFETYFTAFYKAFLQ